MLIFLSGPMGSGKSTLAGRLGERLGLASHDLDQVIEAREQRSVAALFEQGGESGFRRCETEALEELLERVTDGVVSLGGGTVTSTDLRRRLLRAGLLVTLTAAPSVLAERVIGDGARPLLAGADPETRLTELLSQRAAAYAECHAQIDTGALSMDAVLEAVVELSRRALIAVPLGTRSYRVEVGSGVRRRAADLVAGRRVVLVTDDHVGPRWGRDVAGALRAAGSAVSEISLPPGESHKNIRSVERIWDQAQNEGVDRRSMVVAVGGGVIGDLAGFAAATLLRGIPVGHIPSSLLAMVDSSVGGKTGFDTRHGKNLVGAFHQPSFVLADVELLSTLPDIERIAGLSEIVKSAWIEGEAEVARLEASAEQLVAGELSATVEAIHMSCQMKARVVSEDEREAGLRAVLNFGHTVGHAIEAASEYRLRHGECVALGMVAACRISQRLGRMDADSAMRMTRLLLRLRLPVDLDPHLAPTTMAFIASDKKHHGDHIQYVLPGAPGEIELRTLPLATVTELLAVSS